MKIKDITLADYFGMSEKQRLEIAILLADIEPSETLTIKKQDYAVRNINEQWFTFEHRLFLQQGFEERELLFITVSVLFMDQLFDRWDEDRLSKCFKLIRGLKVIGVYPIVIKFWKEVGELIERENLLRSEPTADEIRAGINNLSVFAEWGTVDNLVKRFNGKYSHDEIIKLPYSECFNMLYKDKVENDYREKYNEIIMKK